MSQEIKLIIRALEEVSFAVQDLSTQQNSIKGFLITNFRNYSDSYSPSIDRRLAAIRHHINGLEQLISTNKDNAHLLTNDEDNKKRTPTIEPIRLQDLDLNAGLSDMFRRRRD